MPKFRLTGDILHPGVVEIEVEDLEELKFLLSKEMLIDEFDEFVVKDEQSDCLGFIFDGNIEDENGNEVGLEENLMNNIICYGFPDICPGNGWKDDNGDEIWEDDQEENKLGQGESEETNDYDKRSERKK